MNLPPCRRADVRASEFTLRTVNQILELAEAAGALKRLRRTGWLTAAVDEPESVAEHCFRVALLASAMCDHPGVEPAHMMKMALVHDLAEGRLGDIVTDSGARVTGDVSKKVAAERTEMRRLAEVTGDAELPVLFDEMLEGRTPAARLVVQLDKLEMAIQAYEYERCSGRRLDEFFLSARARLDDPSLVAIFDELIARRGRLDHPQLTATPSVEAPSSRTSSSDSLE